MAVVEVPREVLDQGLPDSIIADWVIISTRRRHNIFLSHSGAQKNFAEQLCVDLERANQSPFFDRRPSCLPRGEEFAQRILTAAQECELAVVVISEEYFSRSKWPLLELAAIVQAPSRPKILPLFLGLSCKEFKRPKRRERWFHAWEEWSKSDDRVCVDVWKEALRVIEGRTGMEYVKALGEVPYRREIVATVCDMVEDEVEHRISHGYVPMLNYFQLNSRP